MKYGWDWQVSVSDMLAVKRVSLAHDYCRLEAITFTDDILEEIGITEELRITKPGRATPDQMDAIMGAARHKYWTETWAGMSETERLAECARIKKRKKIRAAGMARLISQSKGELQTMNHGKG